MAGGVPVIGTGVWGGDAIQHGQTGLIVPTGHLGSLASAMCTLCDDALLRTRSGEAYFIVARECCDDRLNPPVVKLGLLVAPLLPVVGAKAQTIDLTPAGFTPFFSANINDVQNPDRDRNTSFQLLQNLSSTGAGVRLQPLNETAAYTFTATLYSMTGPRSARTFLTSGSQTYTGNVLQFYTVPLAFNFVANSLYDLGFTVDGGGFRFNRFNLEFYRFDGPPTNNAANTAWIVDGGAGQAADGRLENVVTPHLQLIGAAAVVVSEPGSMMLLAAGLIGIGSMVRRRRNIGG